MYLMTPETNPSSRGRWLVLIAALLGWMFDGLEMGLFPLVASDALKDLLGADQSREEISRWIGIITAGFLIGAATGGVVFGWLGDRIGRVRAMTLSVFTYAVFSGICGLATDAWQVAFFRFIASLGMGGEWSLGVALVMEVWPNQSRAWLAGIIGAAANLGYCIIGLVGLYLSYVVGDLKTLLTSLSFGQETIDWLTRHNSWRVLMLFGATPAVLTFLIRLFVPESQKWEREREKGSTSHWNSKDLLAVLLGAGCGIGMVALFAFPQIHTPVRLGAAMLLFLCILMGYLYPIVRYAQRACTPAEREAGQVGFITKRLLLAALLSGVALLGTWGTTQNLPTYASELTQGMEINTRVKPYVQMASAFGATLGCILAALMGDWLGRRITYAIMCVGSMLAIWNVYLFNETYSNYLLVSAFIAGFISASFYGWLPLYLPELFQTKVRATGQGFGFNFGRILAAIGVLQLGPIMKSLGVGWPIACSWLALIYIVGLIAIWFAPETRGRPLPE
jgi:MFS family permease